MKYPEDMSREMSEGGPSEDAVLPSIPEWYRGRAVFITGGSGFMGKVLIEKLLRSCPDLRTVYMLLRAHKGRGPAERLRDVTEQPLFNRLRSEQPAALRKLVPIDGDVMKVGLGLSADDRGLLEREVSVVFHSAASVRFDDTLRAAILMNVRGTREVLRLATGFRDLQAFVHFSTAYSNCERGEVAEQLYPLPGGLDWRQLIRIAEDETLDPALTYLTPKILGRKPNTYVFAKAVGEQLVNDYRHQLPVVIVRPSIVMSTMEEPIPGWVDNFNGPFGSWAGAYTGVLGVLCADGNVSLDLVPVDSAVKAIVYLAYHRALATPSSEHLQVYNCSSLVAPCTLFRQLEVGQSFCEDTPTTQLFWWPGQKITRYWTVFYVQFMLTHVSFALLLDAILTYRNEKPRLTRLYRRIFTLLPSTRVFSNTTFNIHNAKFLAIEREMLSCDRAAFEYSTMIELNKKTTRQIMLGVRQYLLRDPLETLPRARRLLRRFFWLDWALKATLVLALGWTLATRPTLHAALATLSSTTVGVVTL